MTYEGHKIREAEKEERLSTGKVIKMMEIWKRDEKEEGDSDKKRKKNRAESSSILFSVFV